MLCEVATEDELFACLCLNLDTILLLCNWAIASALCAQKLQFIKLFLICFNDGVHLRSARVCCELPHPIRDMLRKDGLVRGCSLFHRGCISPKRERLCERKRS